MDKISRRAAIAGATATAALFAEVLTRRRQRAAEPSVQADDREPGQRPILAKRAATGVDEAKARRQHMETTLQEVQRLIDQTDWGREAQQTRRLLRQLG